MSVRSVSNSFSRWQPDLPLLYLKFFTGIPLLSNIIKLLKMIYKTHHDMVSVCSPNAPFFCIINQIPLSPYSNQSFGLLAILGTCQVTFTSRALHLIFFCLELSYTLESHRVCALHDFLHFIQSFPRVGPS